MPLNKLQQEIALLLSQNRNLDNHLAGGAALHFEANSKRYSNHLDYFHDSVERVTSAFNNDKKRLEENGHKLDIEINQPGFIRASITKGKSQTKIEWVHDSAWRFMPPISHPKNGYQLHPIDLAINKVLALAGRAEYFPR